MTVWLFRIAHAGALVLVAGLAVAGQVVTATKLSERSGDAAVINRAGLQRALSRQIEVCALRLADTYHSGETNLYVVTSHRLQRSLDRFIEGHAALVERHGLGGLRGRNSAKMDMLLAKAAPEYEMVRLTAEQMLVQMHSSDHIALQGTHLANADELASRVSRAVDQFFPEMDAIVHAYEAESADRLSALLGVQVGLGVAIVLALMLDVLLVFEPTARRLRWSTARADAAERQSMAKSALLANVSHELRTPMAAIIGYAERLEREGGAAAGDESLAAIRRSGRHLISLVNDIVDVAKIEAGRMTVEVVEMSPVRVIEEVVSLMRPLAESKGVELRTHYETSMPSRIRSDPTRLRQVLVNLVGNAIKFTAHGTVTLRSSCESSSQRMCFAVSDTGLGMTGDQLAAVRRFEAYTQADVSVAREFGGSGLGLSIAHALASMLGGAIEIDSRLGEGSTFTASIATGDLTDVPFYTPDRMPTLEELERREAEAARLRTTKALGRLPLAGVRVLVADDSTDMRRLLAHHLGRAGAILEAVPNGQAAVTMVRNSGRGFSALVLDVDMPVLDGLAATRELRSSGCTVPVLALTGRSGDTDREQCIAAGCNAYLTKPVDPVELVSQVAALVVSTTDKVAA